MLLGRGKTMKGEIKELDFVNAWISAQRKVAEVISKEEWKKLNKGKSCQQKKSSKK